MIEERDHRFALAGKPSHLVIPASVQAIISTRIDQLDPMSKHVMQVAAVVGREFTSAILEDAVSKSVDLTPCLSALQRSEFICQRGLSARPEYAFRHALIQDVAYTSLPLKTRKQLHRRIAAILEERDHDNMEEISEVLAHHYSIGGDLEKASHYLKLSGDKASRSYSTCEALRLYGEAIDALKKLGEDRDRQAKRLEVHLALESVMRALDYPAGSRENLQEAERLALDLDDRASEEVVRSKMGWYHMVAGEMAEGFREVESAFEAAMQAEDPDLVAPAAINLTQALSVAGDFKRLVKVSSRAISLLERAQRQSAYTGGMGTDNVFCSLLAWKGLALAHIGRFDEGKALIGESMEYARLLNNPTTVALAQEQYATVLWMQGDGREAAKYVLGALPKLERCTNSMVVGACWGHLGAAYLLQGDLHAAAACLENAMEIRLRGGAATYMANFFWGRGWVETEAGHYPQARSDLEETLRLGLANKERWSEAVARIYLGRVMFKQANPNHRQAEQSILQGMRIFEELELKPWYAEGCFFLGELHFAMGQRIKAQRHLKKAEAMFREMGMEYWLDLAQDISSRLKR